jgi:hypothetical protein
LSRSDWIAVAVTLICVSLSYYLGFPKTAFLCGIVGALILMGLIFFRQEDGPKDAISQSVQQAASPVITQNANPIVNVNIGSPSPMHQQGTQPLKPISKRKLNINLVEAKWTGVHPGSDSRALFHESPPGLHDLFAAVVCFRNDPIVGESIEQPTLKAQIVFRDANGAEIADVPRAVWLGQYGESTTFETGQKKCLIVFLQSSQNTLMKLWNESYTTETSWMSGGHLFRIRSEALTGMAASFEISLISHNTCVKQAKFDMPAREGELPRFNLISMSGS